MTFVLLPLGQNTRFNEWGLYWSPWSMTQIPPLLSYCDAPWSRTDEEAGWTRPETCHQMGAHDCFLAGTTRILKIWVVKGSEVQIRCQEKIVRLGVQLGLCKWALENAQMTLRAANFGQRQRLSMWRALGSQNSFQRCKPARSQDGSVPKFVLQKSEVPTRFLFFPPFSLLWPVREQDTSAELDASRRFPYI